MTNSQERIAETSNSQIIDISLNLPSPIQKVDWPNKNAQLWVKRDDLIHDTISGNKWRKLLPFVEKIQTNKIQHIVSFGGAYSNHLHALAYLCARLNVKLTAVIRGDYTNRLSPTLQDIQQWGTTLKFVNKIEYKQRSNSDYCRALCETLKADLLIPEGGSHAEGKIGLKTLVDECNKQLPNVTHILLPVASGGTLAGIIANSGNLPSCQLIGIAALKGQDYLEQLVTNLLPKSLDKPRPWKIEHAYHHGGYAKTSPALVSFIQRFEQKTLIPLEPVYSGKLFFALNSMLEQEYFPPNSVILAIHTGGLQGKPKA